MSLSSSSTAIEVFTEFLIIMQVQFKEVLVGDEYRTAQNKKAKDKRDKDRTAQGKMANSKIPTTKAKQRPPFSNWCSPSSDISQITAPKSRPTDGLLNSPNATDRNVEDEFLPIEELLKRPTEVLDLTGEDPSLGQPESPRQPPMADTDGHLQGTTNIFHNSSVF